MISAAKVVLVGGTAISGLAGVFLFAFAGSTWPIAVIGGMLLAVYTAAVLQTFRMRQQVKVLQRKLDAMQADMDGIRSGNADADARLAAVEHRTIESPAFAWRSASTDIEILGTLVSDLARTVAEHERQLGPGLTIAEELIPASMDLGSAADNTPHERILVSAGPGVVPSESSVSPPAKPAVIAELRGILASALASDRLELCLQPVVELPQRKVRGYEATLRLRGESGDLHSETDLRRIASTTGLEADLDRVLVERALHVLRVLRGRKRMVSISCAVTVVGLLSPTLPAALETALRSDPELVRALILEFSDAEFHSLAPGARLGLRALADRGVGLSLGRLPHLKLDIDSITATGIRQIKVSAGALLGGVQGNGLIADIHPADMAEFLRRRGIELQIFDVASEQTVIDSLEYAPPLASGPLFGTARPVRPEVIEPRAVSDSATGETRKPGQPEPETERVSVASSLPQRQSFRSVLRRA